MRNTIRQVLVTAVAAAAMLAAILYDVPPLSRSVPYTGAPLVLACSENRLIIQIHGTDSTGAFQPNDTVRTLDPSRPDPSIFEKNQVNDEFGRLLESASETCLLTYSYDDIYLAQDGVVRMGKNAWNVSTSPWNRQPDELADYLQRLIDAYPPNVMFDIVAYSAGGMVPTYWAARDQTTDAQRQRVKSIIVVDGIVWGVDIAADFLCTVVPRSVRDTEVGTFGRFPCQFRYDDLWTRTVRTTDWWKKIRFATVRARGDLIVLHRFAGLPGKVFLDPALRATTECEFGDWFSIGVGGCVLQTHGSVLEDDGARQAIENTVGSP